MTKCEYKDVCWRKVYADACKNIKYIRSKPPTRFDLLTQGYLSKFKSNIFPHGGVYCITFPYWAGRVVNDCPDNNTCPEYLAQKKKEARLERKREAKKIPRGYISPKIVKAVWRKYKFKCAYCGVSYTKLQDGKKIKMNIDHRIPLAQGGTNEYGNLVLSCECCNLRKGNDIWNEGCNVQSS